MNTNPDIKHAEQEQDTYQVRVEVLPKQIRKEIEQLMVTTKDKITVGMLKKHRSIAIKLAHGLGMISTPYACFQTPSLTTLSVMLGLWFFTVVVWSFNNAKDMVAFMNVSDEAIIELI